MYIMSKFITIKFLKRTHHEILFCFILFIFISWRLITLQYIYIFFYKILSEESFFGEFYADTFSDCPSNIDTRISEDDSSSEYTSASDDVTIRPTKRIKSFVIQYSLA